MNLHQDREAFEALLSDVSRRIGIRRDIVEKGYYMCGLSAPKSYKRPQAAACGLLYD